MGTEGNCSAERGKGKNLSNRLYHGGSNTKPLKREESRLPGSTAGKGKRRKKSHNFSKLVKRGRG